MAALVLVFSCNKDKNVLPKLTSMSEENITVAAEGAQFEVAFKVENPVEGGKITATSAGEWVSVAEVQDSKVVFEAAANTAEESRETEVTIIYEYADGKLSFNTKVSQNGTSTSDGPAIKVEMAEVFVFADGGDYEVKYSVENPVEGATVSASADEADWISGIDCSTENVVKFTVAKNSKKDARNAKLTIKYTYTDGEKTADVTVSQEGDENGSDYDVDLAAKVFDGTYLGAKFSSQAANYWTILSDNGYTEDGVVKNDSRYFRFDIFSTFPEDKENIFVPEGTYTLDMSSEHKSGTFTYTFSRYIYSDNEGGVYEEKIVEGTLNVTREGNDYVFDFTGKTDAGTRCHVTYKGSQSFVDKSESTEQQKMENKMLYKESRQRQLNLVIAFVITLLLVIVIVILVLYYKQKSMYRKLVEMHDRQYRKERLLDTAQTIVAETNNGSGENRLRELFNRIDYIMKTEKLYIRNDISIELVSDMLESNRSYVSKAINEYTGGSFNSYVNSFRVKEAVVILSDEKCKLPIKAIALELGYNNLQSFYANFQKEIGVPPSKYRQEIQKMSKKYQ